MRTDAPLWSGHQRHIVHHTMNPLANGMRIAVAYPAYISKQNKLKKWASTKKKFTKNCKLYLAAGAAQTERWNEDVKRNIKERFLCFTPKLNKSQMQHKPKKTKRVVSHPYNSWIAVSSTLDWPSKFVLCYNVALT